MSGADEMTEAPSWVVEPKLWSFQDHLQAVGEGWFIAVSDIPGRTQISRLAVRTPRMVDPLIVRVVRFDTDLAAAEFVVERSNQGSEFHSRALRAVIVAQMRGARGDPDRLCEPS
jgi:hypothetical protein